jgi:RNA polymerase sigma-70 factor (ECF subfamily)
VERDIRDALTPLVPRLRRFAAGLAGSTADGDDLVQSACERALNRSHQWQPGTRLDSWMYRIIQSIWLNEHRARRIRRHEALEAASTTVGEDGEEVAETRLTLDAVRRALLQLPEGQRAVLMLVCVDGLSYKETADTLGIAIGTVMSRLARGRLALYEKLEASNVKVDGNIINLVGRQ